MCTAVKMVNVLTGRRAGGGWAKIGSCPPVRKSTSRRASTAPAPPTSIPNLPVTPEQLAAEAVAAHEAGAQGGAHAPQDRRRRRLAAGRRGVTPRWPRCARPLPGSAARRDDGVLGAARRAAAAAGRRGLDGAARLRVAELARARVARARRGAAEPGPRRRGRHLPRRGGAVVGGLRRSRSTACG